MVKRFRDVIAVDGASFVASAGEVTGFLGANGAGKTTTIRMLATLLTPSSGDASVAGYDIVRDAEAVRRSIGFLTEEAGLYDRLTPREQLEFFGSLHDLPAKAVRARIDHLGDALGLSDCIDRRAGQLSKGNRQKVSLARALVHDPPVLLLDEPTAALDVVTANAVEEMLSGGILAGKTVLLSTHVPEEASRLCARIVVIAHGRIVGQGSPRQIATDVGASDLRGALLHLMGEPLGAGV